MNVSEQNELVLNSCEKDIKTYFQVLEHIKSYEKYKKTLEDSLMTKMKANGLTELGALKIVKEPTYKTISYHEFLNLNVKEPLKNLLQVRVDKEETKTKLLEIGFTNVTIQPLLTLLDKRLQSEKEILTVKWKP